MDVNQIGQKKMIRIEDILVWAGNVDLGVKEVEYDPESYECQQMFAFRDDPTIKENVVHGDRKHIETDTSFVRSVNQLCWQKFGLRRKTDQLTDEECESIHQGASKYGERVTMDKSELLSQDLLQYQYLTYDNTFFFFFMKILFLNALLMTIGYAVPALYRYGLGTRYVDQNLFQCSTSYCQFIDQFSMYNEGDPGSTFTILEWLGLGVIAILQVVFYLAWKYNKEIREVVRYEERCSECSLLIRGLPEGEYSEQDILNFIQKKWKNQNNPSGNIPANQGRPNQSNQQQILSNEKGGRYRKEELQSESSAVKIMRVQSEEVSNHFHIKSIQIIYNLSEAKQMVEQMGNTSKEIWELIEERTLQGQTVNFVLNEQQYKAKKEKIIDLYHRLMKWRHIFLENAAERRKLALGSTLVHFQNRQDRDAMLNFLQKHYQTSWIISWGNLQPAERYSQSTQRSNSSSDSSVIENYKLKVGLAPEPENIIWEKVEHTFDEWQGKHGRCRIIMVMVPLIHVGLIVGLQILKAYLLQAPSSLNSFLSLLVTILIVVSNQLLWIFLEIAVSGQEQRLITSYQVYKNYAGFAGTALSIIIAPVVVNYWWKGNYFGSSAVAGTAFEFHVSTLITIPILMIIQPPEIIKKVTLNYQRLRNWIIRYKYQTVEGNRMKDIYSFYQGSEFDISVTYAFLMANFLHTTFFCMLVPILIPMFAAQVLIFYWACKVRLLKLCKFPTLIRRWLMGIVFANLMVSPLFFAGGCLLSEHAYKSKVFDFDHTPVGLYLFFVWWAIFSVIALFVDRWLQNKQIFKCVQAVDDFTNLKEFQASRSKVYPSKSTSYFIGNNVLNLFGFEKSIMGTVRNKNAEQLLEMFCQAQVSGNPELTRRKMKEILRK